MSGTAAQPTSSHQAMSAARGATPAGRVADETTTAMIAYVLLLLPVLILPLIGVVIAFVNRSTASDWLATH